MNPPVVLDTSVVIQFLDAAHPGHADALDLLSGVAGPLVMHDLNLAEVLVGGFAAGIQDELLRTMTEDMGIETWGEVGTGWVMHLARVRARSTPRLKMPDAVVLATALRIEGAVATFDERLQNAALAAGRGVVGVVTA